MMLKLGSVGRVFSGDKVVESQLLNVLGAQVFRTIAARSIYHARPVAVSEDVKDKLETLERDGVVVWPGFLSPEHFEQVQRECFELVPAHPETLNRTSGANKVHALHVRKVEAERLSNIHRFLADRRLEELLEAAERRPLGPLSKYAKIEHLIQGKEEEGADPQSSHHSDTFFNCHKAWFYVAPVTMKDGPLTFNKATHKLTPRRLGHIYRDSCIRTGDADPSRRVTAEEMAEIGKPIVLTCPANTLVVANVCGYHSRRQGEPGAERWAVQLGARTDPFRTLPLAKTLSKARRERSQA
jgi:hypothetical protein